MRAFKRLYSKWIDETEEFDTVLSIKRHDNYKELKSLIKSLDSNEDKNWVAGFLVKDLSDEELRSQHPIILLKILAKKNIVPKKYRENIDEASEFWILWYESLIFDEKHFG